MEGGRGRRRKETQHDGLDTWVARGEECDVSKNGSRNFFFEEKRRNKECLEMETERKIKKTVCQRQMKCTVEVVWHDQQKMKERESHSNTKT